MACLPSPPPPAPARSTPAARAAASSRRVRAVLSGGWWQGCPGGGGGSEHAPLCAAAALRPSTQPGQPSSRVRLHPPLFTAALQRRLPCPAPQHNRSHLAGALQEGRPEQERAEPGEARRQGPPRLQVQGAAPAAVEAARAQRLPAGHAAAAAAAAPRPELSPLLVTPVGTGRRVRASAVRCDTAVACKAGCRRAGVSGSGSRTSRRLGVPDPVCSPCNSPASV